jgi:hypothetical protein
MRDSLCSIRGHCTFVRDGKSHCYCISFRSTVEIKIVAIVMNVLTISFHI